MSRIFLQEPDRILIIRENRAKRAAWVFYLAVAVMFALLVVGFLVRLP
ncbi:hypothetical protein AB4Y96_09055 [Phyllobacterium sp. TAF24]